MNHTGHTVLVLGYGLQGRAAVHDLVRSPGVGKVIVADARPGFEADLPEGGDTAIEAEGIDAADEEAIRGLVRKADAVVELLPGRFAAPTGLIAAEEGKPLASSMYYLNPALKEPEARRRQEELLQRIDDTARRNGVGIVSEFGMDPGLDLLVSADLLRQFDRVDQFHSYGAGFPEPEAAKGNPLGYKFTWTVRGVMSSYRRPGRYRRGGDDIDVGATEMFAPEHTHLLELPEVGGTLECFPNGNALDYAETLGIADTAADIGRYICRRPGHGAFWHRMAECGFLDDEPLDVEGAGVVPAAFTASILSAREEFWYKPEERDIALVRVDVEGMAGGERRRRIAQMIDRRDLETGFTAMQRTVGFPVSIAVQLLLDGRIASTGLLGPADIPLETVAPELAQRGMQVEQQDAPPRTPASAR